MDVNPSDRDNHSGPERKDSPAVVGTSPRGAKRCESLRRRRGAKRCESLRRRRGAKRCESLRRRRGAKRRTHVLRTIADEGLLLASHERIESPGGWPFSGSALSRPLSSGGAQRAFESKQRRSGAFAPSSAEPTVSPRNEQRRAAGANALPPFSPQLCRIHSRSCRDSRISRQGAAGAKVAFAFANATLALTPSESRLLLPVERAGEASGSKAPYPSHSFPPTLRHPFRVRGPGDFGPAADERENRNREFTGRRASTSKDSENSRSQSPRERLTKNIQQRSREMLHSLSWSNAPSDMVQAVPRLDESLSVWMSSLETPGALESRKGRKGRGHWEQV